MDKFKPYEKFVHISNGKNQDFDYILDGKNMYDKDNALTEIYKKLSLSYVEHANYDALDEWLDPEEWEPKALKILIIHAEDFAAKAYDSAFSLTMEAFKYANQRWTEAKGDQSFLVYVQS